VAGSQQATRRPPWGLDRRLAGATRIRSARPGFRPRHRGAGRDILALDAGGTREREQPARAEVPHVREIYLAGRSIRIGIA